MTWFSPSRSNLVFCDYVAPHNLQIRVHLELFRVPTHAWHAKSILRIIFNFAMIEHIAPCNLTSKDLFYDWDFCLLWKAGKYPTNYPHDLGWCYLQDHPKHYKCFIWLVPTLCHHATKAEWPPHCPLSIEREPNDNNGTWQFMLILSCWLKCYQELLDFMMSNPSINLLDLILNLIQKFI